VEKEELIKQTEERYPFLTGIKYGENEYIGIVINHDNSILTFYDLDKIPNNEIRKQFLELGETWWWESNRSIPINLFLKDEWVFEDCKVIFNNKNLNILSGPCTSLNNIVKKRKKRKSITLIRDVD